MAGFERAELEEMVERWLQANRDAEAADQIREYALGNEMAGLDGWTYPYEEIVIDETKAMVVGFWRQRADATRDDGTHYEVHGIGGSWFRYAGDGMWNWQRDWFDFGNAAALFMEMMGANALSEGMTARMTRSLKGDGFYDAGKAPVTLWER